MGKSGHQHISWSCPREASPAAYCLSYLFGTLYHDDERLLSDHCLSPGRSRGALIKIKLCFRSARELDSIIFSARTAQPPLASSLAAGAESLGKCIC